VARAEASQVSHCAGISGGMSAWRKPISRHGPVTWLVIRHAWYSERRLHLRAEIVLKTFACIVLMCLSQLRVMHTWAPRYLMGWSGGTRVRALLVSGHVILVWLSGVRALPSA
jgi:hypothetical protein